MFQLRSFVPNSSKVDLNFVRRFINELRNPMDIYASLRPLLFVCFVSGMAPFKVIGTPGNRNLVLSVFGLAFTVFHLGLFSMCYARVINDKILQMNMFSSNVSRFGEITQSIMSSLAFGFALILCFLKRKKLLELLQLMTKIDRRLVGFGVEVNYKKASKIVRIVLAIRISLEITLIGANFIFLRSYEYPTDFFVFLFYLLPVDIIFTQKAKYICIMQLIENQFNYINVTLNNLRLYSNGKRLNGASMSGNRNDTVINMFCEISHNVEKRDGHLEREKCDVIAELCRTHEELCDACNLAHEYFSQQMLVTITIEFVMSLFNVYYMIDVTFAKDPIPGIDTVALFALLTFYTVICVVTIFGIVRSAELVVSEVCSKRL